MLNPLYYDSSGKNSEKYFPSSISIEIKVQPRLFDCLQIDFEEGNSKLNFRIIPISLSPSSPPIIMSRKYEIIVAPVSII